MSPESWIGIAAIVVTLGLAGAGAVFGIVGWFLARMLADLDKKIKEHDRKFESQQRDITRIDRRQIVVETNLADRGYLPHRPIQHPSPPPHNIEGTE